MAACRSAPQTYSAKDPGEFEQSSREAVEATSAGGNVRVITEEGDAHSPRFDGYQTNAFIMAAAYSTAKLPVRVTVALDNSPPAQKVRSECPQHSDG